MPFSNSVFLLILNFCHYLSAGVIMPFVSMQVRKHGGNHVVTGALQSFVFIAHLTSRDFVELYANRKKFVIGISLYCCFVYYILFIFCSAWWAVFMIRIAFALTTQVLPFSKEYVAKTEPREKKIRICNLLDIVRVVGLSLGSIASGYIYDYNKDFANNAKVAASLGLISIFCIHQVTYDDRLLHKYTSSLIFSIPTITLSQLENWKKTKIQKELNDVLLKLSYILTFAIYFSRSSFLLRYNYHASNVMIGWSKGYHYILTFFFNGIVPFVKSRINDKLVLLERSMVICIFTFFGLYFAPNYKCFLICYIPLLFSYTLINSLLDDDVLKFKTNINVHHATDTNTKILNVLAPICFGFVSQVCGPKKTKFLSLTPAVFHAIVLNRRLFLIKTTGLSMESSTEVSSEEFIIGPEDKNDSSDEETEGIVRKISFNIPGETETEDSEGKIYMEDKNDSSDEETEVILRKTSFNISDETGTEESDAKIDPEDSKIKKED